jgi:ABC-type Zn uptake system ZnuABC Zn-binding protein ZnuA
MSTIYEITADYRALESLINELTDLDTGETRELTEDEKNQLTEWVNEIEGNFESKFNAIYKVYCNKKAEAKVVKAEKEAMKDEMDRLGKRATARENEMIRLKGLIGYAMDRLKMKKLKTNLFTIGYQATQKSVQPVEGFFKADDIPVEYLTRELSSKAVKDAIKEGRLYEKEGVENRTKLFYMEDGVEKVLKNVTYSGGEALVLR